MKSRESFPMYRIYTKKSVSVQLVEDVLDFINKRAGIHAGADRNMEQQTIDLYLDHSGIISFPKYLIGQIEKRYGKLERL